MKPLKFFSVTFLNFRLVVDGDVCDVRRRFWHTNFRVAPTRLVLYDGFGAPRGQEFGHKYRAKMFQSRSAEHEMNT